MRQSQFRWVILFFCVSSFFTGSFSQNVGMETDPQRELNSSATWVVDGGGGGDFTTIPAAISAASAGDTIYVATGTYSEDITIDKSLSLISIAGPDSTILQFSSSNRITIISDYVTVRGFTMRDATIAISTRQIDYCHLSNNTFVDCQTGIELGGVPGGVPTSGHYIGYNNFSGCGLDIHLFYAIRITIDHNQLSAGIRISASDGLIHYEHTITNNVLHGKPLIYLRDQNGGVLTNEVAVILVNCQNMEIINTIFTDVWSGVSIFHSTNIKVQNCTFSETYYAIEQKHSSNCTFINNTITNSTNAIELSYTAYNLVQNNNITNCWLAVFLGAYATNSIIRKNIISNCQYAVTAQSQSSGNLIYLNQFLWNNNNFYLSNVWNGFYLNNFYGGDVGSHKISYYQSPDTIKYRYVTEEIRESQLGNYWSAFTTAEDLDGNGICDVTFEVYTGIYDYFPLIAPIDQYAVYFPPDIPVGVAQYESDGISSIFEGDTIYYDEIVIKGQVNDADWDQIRLEVELKPIDEVFTNIPTHFSEYVDSYEETEVSITNILNGEYHWQYRVQDTKGNVSEWREFAFSGNTDLVIRKRYDFSSDPRIYAEVTSEEPYWLEDLHFHFRFLKLTPQTTDEEFRTALTEWGLNFYDYENIGSVGICEIGNWYEILDKLNQNVPNWFDLSTISQMLNLVGDDGYLRFNVATTHNEVLSSANFWEMFAEFIGFLFDGMQNGQVIVSFDFYMQFQELVETMYSVTYTEFNLHLNLKKIFHWGYNPIFL